MLISSYKKNLIIITLKNLVEKITSEIKNVNYGGCAILSYYLAESLQKLNIPFTFIILAPSIWWYDDEEDCWYNDSSIYWEKPNQEEFTYQLQGFWYNSGMLSCEHMMIKVYDYIVNYDSEWCDNEFLYEANSKILNYVKDSCLSNDEQMNFDLWNQSYNRSDNVRMKDIIDNVFNNLQIQLNNEVL